MKAKYLLTILAVIFAIGILMTPSYAEIDPDTIVAYWSFDEGAGKTAEDGSGNVLDGELVGGPSWADGKVAKALEFDGSDDYVEVVDITTPPILTFTCWFKKTGAMPAKSQLHWAAEEQAQPVKQVSPSEERSEPVASPPIAPPAAAPAEPVEPKRPMVPQLRAVRVTPVPVTSGRLGNGQIDLMNGARLSAVPVFGSVRPRAGRPAPADAFDARFTGRGD